MMISSSGGSTTHGLDRHTALAGFVVAGAFARSAYRFWNRYDNDNDDHTHNSNNNDDDNNDTNTNIIPSPLRTLIPKLSAAEAANLPYPPHGALPGQRDVQTPCGSIRVYEWGPEDGERVLMVHGISTPCIALGDLGRELVGRGYRVCVFDLFGRGYSDAPASQTYNTQLYTTQILLVLASSPLPWLSTATFPSSSSSSTASHSTNPLLQSPPTCVPASSTSSPAGKGNDRGGFHLVGYSLGSCLCVSFASHFPDKVRSLSLVAPSGLIRGYHVSRQSRLLYESGGWIPETVVRWIVKGRIRPVDGPAVEGRGVLDGVDVEDNVEGKGGGPSDLAVAETNTPAGTRIAHSPSTSTYTSSPGVAGGGGGGWAGAARKKSPHSDATGGKAFDSALISPKHYPSHVTVSSVVRWQVDHHQGFLDAFLSTIRNAPIYQPKGAEDWRRLRGVLSRGTAGNGAGNGGGAAKSRKSLEGRVGTGNRDGNGNGNGYGSAGCVNGLARKARVLVVLGGQDSVIDKDETVDDVTAALGAECVDFEVLEAAGHEVVLTESERVGRILGRYFERL